MFGFKTITKMRLVSRVGIGATTLAISILLLFSYYGQQVGQFTIDVGQELYLDNKMFISESVDFRESKSRLIAEPLGAVNPIGYIGYPEKIPIQVEAILDNLQGGNNNGKDFFAYTFYTKNAGEQDFSYNLSIYIDETQNHLDEAIRVMIIKNYDITGENVETEEVYAKKQSTLGKNPGSPEIGSIMFVNNKTVINENRYEFKKGQIDKYTVIMWVHGEDADCIDIGERKITDGLIKVSMKFSVITV